jgi:hypothetical protein
MLQNAALHVRLRPASRRTGKRWCVDPALLRDPAFPEPFESAAILDEIRGDLGLLLWQLSRDVLLWGAVAPEKRLGLFRSAMLVQERLLASATDERLYSAVRELTELLRNGSRTRERQVVDCCHEVARWAAQSGFERTAIAFAQAAAMALPADPALYVGAGRLLARFRCRTAARRGYGGASRWVVVRAIGGATQTRG